MPVTPRIPDGDFDHDPPSRDRRRNPDVSESLNAVNAKVKWMSAADKESMAGRDRLAEKQRLQRQLDRLYAEQDRLLAERPEAADMMPMQGHPVPEIFRAWLVR